MGAKSAHELEAQSQASNTKPSSQFAGRRLLQALVVAGWLLFCRDQWLHRGPDNIKTPDFSSLHYSKQCPDLKFIGTAEFADRRTALGKLLRGDGSAWGAYISEPSYVVHLGFLLDVSGAEQVLRSRPDSLYCER